MSEMIVRALTLFTVDAPQSDLEHRSFCAQAECFGGPDAIQERVKEAYEQPALTCDHCGKEEGEEWMQFGIPAIGSASVKSKRSLRLTPDVIDGNIFMTCNECDWLDDLEQLAEAQREAEAGEPPVSEWSIDEIKSRFNSRQSQCYDVFSQMSLQRITGSMEGYVGLWTSEQITAIKWLVDTRPLSSGRTTVLSVLYAEGAIESGENG